MVGNTTIYMTKEQSEAFIRLANKKTYKWNGEVL